GRLLPATVAGAHPVPNTPSTMRRITLLFPPWLLVLLAGCNTAGGLPPETDATRGRELLALVLDTWVRGGTVHDLKNGSPPITAYDPDWEAGARLVKYTIDPADGRAGVDLLLTVTLTLTQPDGKTREKTVNFSVAIGSQNAVLRKQ